VTDEPAWSADEFTGAVDIYVGSGAPHGAETPLVEAFSAPGVRVRVRVWPTRRGADTLNWLFLVALPLQSFLGAFGGKLAEDAHRKLRGIVRPAHGEADRAPAGRPVVLQDTATGIRIVLGPEVDGAAYRKLRTLDLAQFRYDTLRYETAEARWVSVPFDGPDG